MPRRATSRTRRAASSMLSTNILPNGRMPYAIRTTLQGAEALSIGLVNAVTETVVTAMRGVEEIGGDLGRLAMNATSGAVGTGREVGGGVGRVAVGAAQGAANAVQRAGASAARMVGISARRPLRKMEPVHRRRRARRASAA